MILKHSPKLITLLVTSLMALSAFAQTKEIKGTVTDPQGNPVVGASVMVAELKNVGTVTDIDGLFTVTLSEGQAADAKSLVVSCIGMTTVNVSIPVDGKPVSVLLRDDSSQLQELVVIGYGSVKKKDLTGSVTNLSDKQFNKGVVTSVSDMVSGQVAGLVITKEGGDPTTGATMRLRGTTSLVGGNGPLVVIDGVPDASMNLVSPEDVESISVLKDASAAAIYGARSANGVIIITTKKGHEGRTSVSYNGYYALERAANNLDMLTADEWRAYVAENNITSAIDYGYDTKWWEEMLRTGSSQSHSVSLTGGTANTQYRAGVTFLDQKGIVLENGLRRINANASISQKAMNDKLKIDLSMMTTYEDWTDMSWNSNIWSYAYNLNPTMPVYNNGNPDEGYFQPYGYLEYNPVSELKLTDMDKSRNYSQGRLAAEYKIFPFLSANVSGSMSRNSFSSGFYVPRSAESGRSTNGTATRTASLDRMKLLEANITFDKLFADTHKVNFVAGYSWQEYVSESGSASNRNFSTDAFSYNNLGAGMDLMEGDVASYKASSRLISFYGRLNYDYKSKYLFTATLRRDGSSKFGRNNKWGYFPSASAAWRVSAEPFMEGLEWIDDLKVRASYGVTGNQDIGNYRTMAIYGASGYYYDSGKFYAQYAPSQNENPNLRWERTAQLDLGIDFAFFDNRLRGSVEYYDKRTSDLLYSYPVPVPPYQYGTMMANVGKVSNKGVEITVSGTPVTAGDFRWDASVNFATNRNMVESLSNEEFSRDKVYLGSYSLTGLAETTAILESGHPIGTFYGAKYIGTDEDGIFQYEDVNGDGKFVYTDDRTYIGNPQPDFTINFSSQFTYKNWYASFLLRGVFGNDVLNGTDLYLGDIDRLPGENALKSALTRTSQTKVYSSYFIEDGSFVRLDNIQLGYNFKLKESAPVKQIRLSLTANNLFIITGYSGIDPEVGQDGLYFGIDARKYYPKTRSVSLGLNITL